MVVSERLIPDECPECGRDFDDEYEVEVYHVENPAQSGYHNPVIRRTLDALGHEAGDMHYPTCPDCEPPTKPPAPDGGSHHCHLANSALGAFVLGAMANAAPATMTSSEIGFAALASVALAAVAVGEYLQIARIHEREKPAWERKWDVEPVLADDEDADPVEDAREAFLAGEIDEAELEERLDEELADIERDRELLTER
ncbi:hypothetical protein BDK61_1475 [Haloarcula quadrata]|uniref:Uncharacterized protein n=1 Tax=Haloarcula quadrata TaxID=182779 RepID=A0A495R4D4_9EURY|nr:hypothetical protein [Haloarcula quadrata]RKS82175.1 hypothetical protein BDK61_1475 [Haloarcula quadrata]